MRFFARDRIKLDPSKIIKDDEDELVIETIVASEIVHQYDDGWAYKPAKQLEAAAWTLDGRWVKLMAHPTHGLVATREDISGFTDNIKFRKNLKDPKTDRPNRRGVTVHTHFFKHDKGRPGVTPLSDDLYAEMMKGNLIDVSVGFTFEKDETPGEFNGAKYDYAQTNIFFDHTVQPCEAGRCPSPYCGIGMDQVMPIRIGGDPYKSVKELPDKVKGLPKEAQSMFLKVVNAALKTYKGNEKKAFATAWAAVKEKYKKVEGKWVKKSGDEMKIDSMSIEEITEKINELRDLRQIIRGRIDDFYAKKKSKPDPVIEKLYEELDDVANEIRAYQEAKVQLIVSNATKDEKPELTEEERVLEHFKLDKETWDGLHEDIQTSYIKQLPKIKDPLKEFMDQYKKDHPNSDCPICDKIESLGPKRFSALLSRVYGKDIIKLLSASVEDLIPSAQSTEGTEVTKPIDKDSEVTTEKKVDLRTDSVLDLHKRLKGF